MLSASKPLVEFGKPDKCLLKYGKHFEYDDDREVICSSDINNDDTFIILNGVTSLRRGENVPAGAVRVPFIMGFPDDMIETDTQYRLITENGCTEYHLPASQTVNIIEEYQLWRGASC